MRIHGRWPENKDFGPPRLSSPSFPFLQQRLRSSSIFLALFSLSVKPLYSVHLGENPLEIEIPSPAMAFAPSINASFSAQLHSWVPKKCLFLCIDHEPANLKFSLPGTRPSRASSALAFGRRRKDDAPVAKKEKKKGRNEVNSMSSFLVY